MKRANAGIFFRVTTVVTLTGGTIFLMWLGEQITARGVGNGTSLIIFSGIVANLSSDSARAPEPRHGGYAATKAAVSAFSESVSHEVARHGVHVHVVYPGWVPTAMGMSGIGEGDPLPPKPVRRTEEQVSALVLDRLGRDRLEINAAWLPQVAPIARTLFPHSYQRGLRRFANT